MKQKKKETKKDSLDLSLDVQDLKDAENAIKGLKELSPMTLGVIVLVIVGVLIIAFK